MTPFDLVVLLSESLVIQALRAGARDYLRKPIQLEELLRTHAAGPHLLGRTGARRDYRRPGIRPATA